MYMIAFINSNDSLPTGLILKHDCHVFFFLCVFVDGLFYGGARCFSVR